MPGVMIHKKLLLIIIVLRVEQSILIITLLHVEQLTLIIIIQGYVDVLRFVKVKDVEMEKVNVKELL